MSIATFNEYNDNLDDKIIRDFLLENNLISKEDLNENPLARELFKRIVMPAGRKLKMVVWNTYAQQAFAGAAVFGYKLIGLAALASLIAAWFGIDPGTAADIAEAIYYVGITVGAAFIALMGRRIALKFINYINKNKIMNDVKKLEKNKKLSKADLETIKKIAKKYNAKRTLDKKELEKFKKKVA